jgi:hypothetical protein
MEVDAPNTQIIRDLVLAPIERGDIREQSFAFTIGHDDDTWEGLDEKSMQAGVTPTRTINNVSRLYDVSPVTNPAYPDTSVAVRSLEAAKEDIDAPPFVPLTVPEMLRNYADVWEKTDDDDKVKELSSEILSEVTERFTPGEPTQAQEPVIPIVDPTKDDQDPGDPTKAEPEARDRLDKYNSILEKYKEKS